MHRRLRSLLGLEEVRTFEEVVADVCVRVEPLCVLGAIVVETRISARILVPADNLPPQAAAALALRDDLPEHVRADLRGRLGFARGAVAGGVAVLYLGGKLGPGELCDAAIVVVAELARRGMEGIHALRELPGAEYEAPRGAWDARTPPRVRLPAANVTFELQARDGGGVRTVAWTEIAAGGPSRPLPAPLRNYRSAIVYPFDSVETNAPRLLAAAELLRATAASLRAERYG